MLEHFRGNMWFTAYHWPINEPHVRLMVSDVVERIPPEAAARVLDIGCFNGYISYLFARLGYRVTGADVVELPERQELFAENGIDFVYTNFNDLSPLREVPDASFEIVILAQVIEHILNHPLGFVRDIARITAPGGLLILTTPHPATVMNVVRVLRGTASLWGTNDFIKLPKIADGEIISHGEIHYREYLSSEIASMLDAAGYDVVLMRYLGLGAANAQSKLKRLLKRSRLTHWLMSHRLFGSNHYFLARKR